MEHQLAIFPVVSHRPQPGQSFRFCLVEYYRLFSKCSEIKFSGLHYRDFPKSKLGYVTFNFFLERDDSGKNFNQCNTKMVPNISCIHKNSFSRRRFGRSISDQHFSAQLHIALQKTHICTHTHTHTAQIFLPLHMLLCIFNRYCSSSRPVHIISSDGERKQGGVEHCWIWYDMCSNSRFTFWCIQLSEAFRCIHTNI